MCAANFMERQLKLNMEKWWDFRHGNWRDIMGALKATRQWASTMMCMVAYNVPHGPWNDDMRYQQCKVAMGDLLTNTKPSDCPLFQSMLPELMSEAGLEGLLAGDSPDQALRQSLLGDDTWAAKGEKVVVNRFMGMRRKAKLETQKWSRRSFAYQYTCLEQGFFNGAKFNKLVVKAAENEDQTTSSKREQPGDKALKNSCQNSMVVAAMVYANPDNRVMQTILWVATQPLEEWHHLQSTSCRSAAETRDFLVQQQGPGGFLKVMACTLAVVMSPTDLAMIGFDMPTKPLGSISPWKSELEDPEVGRQNDFAQEMGRFVMALVGKRLLRLAFFLRGWPGRCAGFLVQGARGAEALKEFKLDYDAYLAFETKANLPKLPAILDRSVFNLTSVQQVRLLAEEAGWSLTPGF